MVNRNQRAYYPTKRRLTEMEQRVEHNYKHARPNMIVTVTEEIRMEYYGYWLTPVYECLRPGDIAVTTMYFTYNGFYNPYGWVWCEFIRNDQPLRAQVGFHHMVLIENPTPEMIEEYREIVGMSYSIWGDYVYDQSTIGAEIARRDAARQAGQSGHIYRY